MLGIEEPSDFDTTRKNKSIEWETATEVLEREVAAWFKAKILKPRTGTVSLKCRIAVALAADSKHAIASRHVMKEGITERLDADQVTHLTPAKLLLQVFN